MFSASWTESEKAMALSPVHTKAVGVLLVVEVHGVGRAGALLTELAVVLLQKGVGGDRCFVQVHLLAVLVELECDDRMEIMVTPRQRRWGLGMQPWCCPSIY